MIYGSAVRCTVHPECLNALVESSDDRDRPWYIYRPVHGSLETARGVAEQLADKHRSRAHLAAQVRS